MKEKELNAFLASVRRTRFVDYLDPLGETAQNALDRRLSWARVSQHDPAYAGEARFLLDNAEGLREVLRRELDEDDWIEEADVGREFEREPSRPPRMRENDRVTEIFQADDLEVSSAPQKVQVRPTKGGAPLPPSGRSTPRPSTPRPATRSVAVSDAQPPASSGRSQSEGGRKSESAKGSRPEPARVAQRPDPDGRQVTEPPRRGPEPPRRGAETAPRGVETARRVEPSRAPTPPPQSRTMGSGSRTGSQAMPRAEDGGRGTGRTATPGPASRAPSSVPPRSTTAPVSRTGTGYQPTGTADSLPPLQDTRGSDREPGKPSYGLRNEPPVREPPSPRSTWNEATQRNEAIRGRSSQQQRSGGRPGSSAEENTSPLPPHGGGRNDVDFDGWDAPDDPVSTTGIMRMEDVTGPRREEVIGIDGVETLSAPRAPRTPMAAAVVIDETATAPSAATRLRRPHSQDAPHAAEKRASVMAAMPMPKVRASVDPTPRRSRLPALIIGLAMVALLVVVAAGAVIVPVVYSQTDFGRPPSMPEVVIAEPEPIPDRLPGAADPVPAPVEPAVPTPEQSTVAAAPQPALSPVPVAVAPATPPVVPPSSLPSSKLPNAPRAPLKPPAPPDPVPAAPVPAAPRSSAPPLDVSGLWIGSTSTGLSFKLTVLGQTEGDFEGTVEVQLEDMTFDSFAINGKVDGSGALTFRGDGASFNGKVAGRKASGSYTLAAGATPVSWNALH